MKEVKKANVLSKLEKTKKEGKRILKVTMEEKKELEKLKNYEAIENYQSDRECKKNEFGKYFEIKLIEK